MRIHILGRHDSLLFAGFMFALLVVFQTPIQRALDVAREIERTYNVALMPALLILTVMFVFHQYTKRSEMKAEAVAAAAEMQLARGRAKELEQLMLFGQSLARALTTDALREAVWRHLPAMGDGHDVWVVLRGDSGWDRLMDTGCVCWPAGEIEGVADSVLAAGNDAAEATAGGHLCFRLLVGQHAVGVLGASGDLDPRVRQKLGAAAALLTIAVRNTQLFTDVRDHSVRDALTGCFTKAHTMDVLDGELARSRRTGTAVSVVLFDVDFFKRINDTHGHPCGDTVLAAVGHRMRQVLRRSDTRCRYGGDEFMILLPETSLAGATRVADWLRGEMEQPIVMPSGDRISITISVGVATSVSAAVPSAALIEQADRALYDAKAAGRNCVHAAAEAPVPFEAGPRLVAVSH